jgi:hypothetical protein
MRRRTAACIGLIGATSLGVLARALTITPNAYDFGTVAVGGGHKAAAFRVSGLGTTQGHGRCRHLPARMPLTSSCTSGR